VCRAKCCGGRTSTKPNFISANRSENMSDKPIEVPQVILYDEYPSEPGNYIRDASGKLINLDKVVETPAVPAAPAKAVTTKE
jgi:hypothetical protein